MKATRTIHTNASIVSGPASQLVPDVKMQSAEGEEGFVLGFVETTPDGGQEVHYYVLDKGGKEAIVTRLSGGIIPATAGAVADLPKMSIPRERKH